MGMDGAMGHGGVPPTGREPYGLPAIPMPYQGGPMNTNIPVVFTEDAATKLSDRVRRRCFNCCTSDTSTWRRSNLSPGKVLCNKCGLFERTHSRPRPEQFPHKRGPLASSVLHSRSPPTNHTVPSPHMHNQTVAHSPSSQGQGSPSMTNTLPPISGPPYSYPPHPSLAPLSSVAPPPQSNNGSYHASRREDDHKKPISASRPWQDRGSPPISRQSSMNGKASPGPPPLSSGPPSKSSRSRHDHVHRDEV